MFYRIFGISFFLLSFLFSRNKDKTTEPSNLATDSIDPIDPIPNNETVTIGTQVWMVKNLDVEHYRNGDTIPQVTDKKEWDKLTTGAWCYYGNDANNGKTYGKLYNWFAVNDPRGIAPSRWHVPSDAEWTELTTYLGGEDVAGGKLKEVDTLHWYKPNRGATNESGFSALPGGYRYSYSSFSYFGINGHWWSSTKKNYTMNAWIRYLTYGSSSILRVINYKGNAFSVRCIHD